MTIQEIIKDPGTIAKLHHVSTDPQLGLGVLLGSMSAWMMSLSFEGWLSVTSGVLAVVGLGIGAAIGYFRLRITIYDYNEKIKGKK
jgi:hypothetical protein